MILSNLEKLSARPFCNSWAFCEYQISHGSS